VGVQRNQLVATAENSGVCVYVRNAFVYIYITRTRSICIYIYNEKHLYIYIYTRTVVCVFMYVMHLCVCVHGRIYGPATSLLILPEMRGVLVYRCSLFVCLCDIGLRVYRCDV